MSRGGMLHKALQIVRQKSVLKKAVQHTIIDIFCVLSMPLEFFSSNLYLYAGATSLERLIKQGCKCRPKVKKTEQEQSTEKEQNN